MTCASGNHPTLRTRVCSRTIAKAPLAIATPMRLRPGTMVPVCELCCSTSGCLLRCTYCHNPDTWHLKDGTYVSAQQVLDRLAGFASAIKALDGGLTISGGEPMVQLAFTKRIFAGAKKMGLHTAIETSGFLGDRVDDSYLSVVDLIPARHQKLKSRHLSQGHEPRSGPHPAVCRAPRVDRQAHMGSLHTGARPD